MKCKCGNVAECVAEGEIYGGYYKEWYCDKCNRKFITRNGKYIRDGCIPEPWIEDTPTQSLSGWYDN